MKTGHTPPRSNIPFKNHGWKLESGPFSGDMLVFTGGTSLVSCQHRSNQRLRSQALPFFGF